MKGLLLVFVFSSHFLFSQSNIAIFHSSSNIVAMPSTHAATVNVAPFDLINGMVVIKATVDGVLGNFILDTGSPGIILNNGEFKESNQVEGTGIGGHVSIGQVKLKNFSWGGIEKSEVQGFSLDISRLEKATGKDLMGLIGYEIFSNHELFIDYPNSTIKIYSHQIADEVRRSAPDVQVPFILNGHLPTIVTKVNNKKLFLGIDSGAGVNLIDRSYFKKIGKKEMQNIQIEEVVGLDGNPQRVKSATLPSVSVKDEMFDNFNCHFMDLSFLSGQFDSRLDGLLGYPFLQEHAIAINFKEKRVYIWK